MQILGLLGMRFDAVVVEVKTFLLLFRLAVAILCYRNLVTYPNPLLFDLPALKICHRIFPKSSYSHLNKGPSINYVILKSANFDPVCLNGF